MGALIAPSPDGSLLFFLFLVLVLVVVVPVLFFLVVIVLVVVVLFVLVVLVLVVVVVFFFLVVVFVVVVVIVVVVVLGRRPRRRRPRPSSSSNQRCRLASRILLCRGSRPAGVRRTQSLSPSSLGELAPRCPCPNIPHRLVGTGAARSRGGARIAPSSGIVAVPPSRFRSDASVRMIIVCPSCQARYKFDESKLGDRPRAQDQVREVRRRDRDREPRLAAMTLPPGTLPPRPRPRRRPRRRRTPPRRPAHRAPTRPPRAHPPCRTTRRGSRAAPSPAGTSTRWASSSCPRTSGSRWP